MKKVGVLLHGCGVYDGTEIQEAVLSLLALKEQGFAYQCFAPNRAQYHHINHLNGEEVEESRNLLMESARIARGEIMPLEELDANHLDALLIPGGFGAAKNLTTWAFEGANSEVQSDFKAVVLSFIEKKKPIVALCMAPTAVGKALQGSSVKANLSVGNADQKSLYGIGEIHEQIALTGHQTEEVQIGEVSVDKTNKIICSPCYMMDVDILSIKQSIDKAMEHLAALI